MANTLHVVTPSMNAINTIDRTILSVVTQAGDFRIRYHVQDGGSKDGTFERLMWWQERLSRSDYPLQCQGLEFSCRSGPDDGMYDALVTGFDRLNAPGNDFMTWINADDVFLYGAFATVSELQNQFAPEQLSWVGGHAAVMKNDHFLHVGPRPLPTRIIRAGLCEGVHWLFVQQEGTFFRRWLWDRITPQETIRPLRLAGDWNLWRLFAEHCDFAQLNLPMGAFRVVENQLSTRMRDAYMAEIEAVCPLSQRRAAFKELDSAPEIRRRKVPIAYKTGQFSLVDTSMRADFKRRYHSVFNTNSEMPSHEDAEKLIAKGLIHAD